MIDEAVERAEQEALARREAAQNETQAAAEEEARRQMAMDIDGGGITAGDGMERNLDDEVPEADENDDDENENEDEDEVRDVFDLCRVRHSAKRYLVHIQC